MATILGTKTIKSVNVISTDTNPNSAGGTSAPVGSLCVCADGSGTFHKIGTANTDWYSLPFYPPVNTANSNTVVNTTVETNFTGTGITLVVPANTLTVGSKIRIRGTGIFGSLAAGVITLRLKIGAVTINTTGTIALAANTNQGWKVEATLTIRSIGAGGTLSSFIHGAFASTGATVAAELARSNGTQAINTTIANTIQISAQWTAASATNTITLENIDYQIIKA